MKKTVILAVLALLPAAAQAMPDRISILMGSNHIGATYDFEQTNPGVFLTWEKPVVDLSVGAYRNSFGDLSLAVTVSKAVLSNEEGTLSLSGFAGLASYPDYSDCFLYHAGDIVPLVGIQVVAGPVFVQIMPGGNDMVAVVAAGLTFPIK